MPLLNSLLLNHRKRPCINLCFPCLESAVEIGAYFNVYTDGSASDGLFDRGVGFVVTRGNPTSPEVLKTIRKRGVYFTCSCEEEKRTLEEAIHWLQTGVPQNSPVAVFTYFQSLCAALLGKSTEIRPPHIQA